MLSFHLIGLPRQEFGEPGRRGLDDLFIQRPYEGVERRVIERLENPLAMLYPQTLTKMTQAVIDWIEIPQRNGSPTKGVYVLSFRWEHARTHKFRSACPVPSKYPYLRVSVHHQRCSKSDGNDAR
jgi:hypothetical protein